MEGGEGRSGDETIGDHFFSEDNLKFVEEKIQNTLLHRQLPHQVTPTSVTPLPATALSQLRFILSSTE